MGIALAIGIILALAAGGVIAWLALSGPGGSVPAGAGDDLGASGYVARFISGLTQGRSGTTDTGISFWVSESGQSRPGSGETRYVDTEGLPPKGV